jgi:hypothetical protein
MRRSSISSAVFDRASIPENTSTRASRLIKCDRDEVERVIKLPLREKLQPSVVR